MEADNSNFIPTRSSSLKKTAVQYQEVVYENPYKKKNHSANNVEQLGLNDSDLKPNKNNVFDINRARYEIIKFAKSNTKSNKQKTATELALKLGAKPLKRKSMNYKVILEKKEKDKQQNKNKPEEELQKLDKKFINKSILNNKKNHKWKRKQGALLDQYGKPTIK